MKNTRIMMTQPMGGSQGDIYQIAATVAELNAIYQVRGAAGRTPRGLSVLVRACKRGACFCAHASAENRGPLSLPSSQTPPAAGRS